MARLASYAIVGIIAFSAAAAGSWMLNKQQSQIEESADNEASPVAAEVTPEAPARHRSGETDREAAEMIQEELPVAVRPRPISADEVFRLGTLMREREKMLKNREDILQEDETRLKLVLSDIKAEQQTIDGLHTQVRGSITAAEQILDRIDQQQQDFVSDQQQAKTDLEAIQESAVEFKESENDNIKRMAQWFQAMEPDKAAEFIRELADDGKLDMAVQLLGNFEERDASEVLSAMDDTSLVTELLDKFRMVKRPEKKSRDRR